MSSGRGFSTNRKKGRGGNDKREHYEKRPPSSLTLGDFLPSEFPTLTPSTSSVNTDPPQMMSFFEQRASSSQAIVPHAYSKIAKQIAANDFRLSHSATFAEAEMGTVKFETYRAAIASKANPFASPVFVSYKDLIRCVVDVKKQNSAGIDPNVRALVDLLIRRSIGHTTRHLS